MLLKIVVGAMEGGGAGKSLALGEQPHAGRGQLQDKCLSWLCRTVVASSTLPLTKITVCPGPQHNQLMP